MVEIETRIRKWGNTSLAFIIPQEIVENEKLKPNQKIRAVILRESKIPAKTFGILKKWKKSTPKIMKEIDDELWGEE